MKSVLPSVCAWSRSESMYLGGRAQKEVDEELIGCVPVCPHPEGVAANTSEWREKGRRAATM